MFGGRLDGYCKIVITLLVSIHARVRRATIVGDGNSHGGTSFNPRPRAAGDIRLSSRSTFARVFQSTPACGGRPTRKRLHTRKRLRFNPRPRAAGDLLRGASPPQPMRFQSTPACGGRLQIQTSVFRQPKFQSTPACGGRLYPLKTLDIQGIKEPFARTSFLRAEKRTQNERKTPRFLVLPALRTSRRFHESLGFALNSNSIFIQDDLGL